MSGAVEVGTTAEVVATETSMVTFGIAGGLRRTLTVHADGTLHLWDRFLGGNRTRQVPQARIQPLRDALSRSEWQEVGPFYGKLESFGGPGGIIDHITTVEGGGKSTRIASTTHLPPILREVLEHLGDLASTFESEVTGGATVEARVSDRTEPGDFPKPDVFELAGDGVWISYQMTQRGESLHYRDRQRDLIFSEEQIRSHDIEIGRMSHVQLYQESWGSESLSVLLPSFRLGAGESSSHVSTLAIRTTIIGGIVPPIPPFRPGQQQEFTVVTLQGTARLIAPGELENVPPGIFKHRWLHSHEEDTEEFKVYRPLDFNFPLSRGPRPGFELKENGQFIRYDPAPNDAGWLESVGHWRAEEENKIKVHLPGIGPDTLDIVSLEEGILKIQV